MPGASTYTRKSVSLTGVKTKIFASSADTKRGQARGKQASTSTALPCADPSSAPRSPRAGAPERSRGRGRSPRPPPSASPSRPRRKGEGQGAWGSRRSRQRRRLRRRDECSKTCHATGEGPWPRRRRRRRRRRRAHQPRRAPATALEEKTSSPLVAAGGRSCRRLPTQAHAVKNVVSEYRQRAPHHHIHQGVAPLRCHARLRLSCTAAAAAACVRRETRKAARSALRRHEAKKTRTVAGHRLWSRSENTAFGCAAHLFGQRGDELKVHALKRRRHGCVAECPLRIAGRAKTSAGCGGYTTNNDAIDPCWSRPLRFPPGRHLLTYGPIVMVTVQCIQTGWCVHSRCPWCS